MKNEISGHGIMEYLHARFTPQIKDRVLEWLEANSPRYVVAYEVGKEREKPHHHVAFESPVGERRIKQLFQEWCKDAGLQVARGKANAWYGGVKQCTDASYVCKEGDITASKGFLPMTIQSLIAEGRSKYRKVEDVIQHFPPAPYQPLPTDKIINKRTPMRERFVSYLEKDLGWVRGGKNPTARETIRQAFTFWQGALTNPEAVRMCRMALLIFSDEEHQETILQKWEYQISPDIV